MINLLSVFHWFSVRYFSISQFFFIDYQLRYGNPESPPPTTKILLMIQLWGRLLPYMYLKVVVVSAQPPWQCRKVPLTFGAQNQIKDSFIHKIKPQSLGNKPVHFVLSTISFIIITIWATAETSIFHVNNNSFSGLVLWKTFKHVLITMEN